jgi:hypothetical protein
VLSGKALTVNDGEFSRRTSLGKFNAASKGKIP